MGHDDPAATIVAMGKNLFQLKEKKKDLEAQLKEINKEKAILEDTKLPELMETHEIPKLTIDGHGTLYTQAIVYANILVEDRDTANTWFKGNGHGSLVKETIHAGSLKSWVKEQMDEGKEVPEFCNAKPRTVARTRKA